MKNSLLFSVFTILLSISIFAQSPQAFKYQTVVRNGDGNLIQNQSVSFKMGILDYNLNNFQETLEYEETHTISTNEFGMANLYVGGGTVVSGSMENVEWGQEGHYQFLIIDLDVNGGNNYQSMGYSQLSSVPYALYAESTGDIHEIVNSSGDTKINMPYMDKSIRFISLNTEYMRMTSNGRLGIGTETPNKKLEVNGHIRMTDGNQGTGKIMVSDEYGTATWTDPSNLGGGAWTVSGNNMYSSVSGNVGIGASSPGAKLDVAGRIWQTGLGNSVFIGENAGENDDLSDNRNVFIGNGAGKENTSGNNNIAIGSKALYSNTTGYGNTANGFEALHDNTSGHNNTALGFGSLYSTTSGYFNTALGSESLALNETGDANTAIGFEALLYNSTGSSNVGIGIAALYHNQTGNNNTAVGGGSLFNNEGYSNVAVGSSALYNNTTQSNNVAIGDSALYHNGEGAVNPLEGGFNTAVGSKALFSNTKGIWNTALGYEALFSNNLGTSNTAIGYKALHSNISGQNNTAIGYMSLNSNTNGSNNYAAGEFALNSNTSGYRNLAIGNDALHYHTEGHDNTAIGFKAGYTNIDGNGNVFLGYNAGYNETGSYKLYISNSNASPDYALIYGEFDNDILKFHADIHLTKSTGNEMIIKNDNQWEHNGGVQDFGNGGDYFIMASREGSGESAGIFGDGNNTTIWSAGDAVPGQYSAYLYILDEDNFDNSDSDPYNNGALKAYLSTSGNWVSVSDKNKKENIKKLSNSLEKLMNINGYSYLLKQNSEEKSKGTKQETTYGVLAQEVEQVLPEVIEKNDDGEYFVSYTEFIPVLIEAVKEQQQTIEELRQSIEDLQGEVNQLKKK